MELIISCFVVTMVAVFVLTSIAMRTGSDRDLEDEWTAVGQEFGFQRIPQSRWLLNGEFAGSIIRITPQVDSSTNEPLMSVAIDGSSSMLKFIRIDGEGMLGFLRKRPPGGELLVGDAAFDSTFLVAGPEASLLALLDEPFRAQLLDVRRRGGATLRGGRLMYGLPCDQFFDIRTAIQQTIALARALQVESADIPDRLAANARGTDQPQVRLHNFLILAQLPKSQELAREVARALLEDPEPEMRWEVARRLDVRELDALLALASRERDERVLVPLFEQLAKFAGERLWPAIQQALRSHHESVRRAAAEAASVTGYAGLAPRIALELEGAMKTAEPETLVALADALRALRDPTTEAELVNLLAHESKDVQSAAALALGEFGSVAAVEPLLECSGRLLLGGATKTTILHAVARIQSRIGQVELGALSLAESAAHAGALSLAGANEHDGALSLVDSQRGKPG